jgi:hypothetical protein
MRRRVEVVIRRRGGGRLGSFRCTRAGEGFSCWLSGDRGEGVYLLAISVDLALNCN